MESACFCTRTFSTQPASESVWRAESFRQAVTAKSKLRKTAHARFHVGMASAAAWNGSSVLLTGIKDLPDKYKGVLLDQYGCLHDGKTPYPGAIEAVRHLAEERGMQILLLSNSSRRSAGALDKIAGLGFERHWFVGVVTSGEVTHQHLLERPSPFWQRLGRTVLHITWSTRGQVVLEDSLGLQITEQPAEADFVLAHGTEALAAADGSGAALPKTMSELEELLRQCANVGRPPLVVANPDFVTTSGHELVVMPGTLGRIYASLGGEVHLMGKPSSVIYEAARTLLDVPLSELIAIGDSLEHDVAGAASAGIDSLFVGGGIHAEELGHAHSSGRKPVQHTLQELCTKLNVPDPTYAMQSLTV